MDAATTNNEGLGSPFAGNMIVYPLYRMWALGVQESPVSPSPLRVSGPTVLRGVLMIGDRGRKTADRTELLDISGRKVLDLKPGANDVRGLAPGVYFVREAQAQAQAQAIHKVVVTR